MNYFNKNTEKEDTNIGNKSGIHSFLFDFLSEITYNTAKKGEITWKILKREDINI